MSNWLIYRGSGIRMTELRGCPIREMAHVRHDRPRHPRPLSAAQDGRRVIGPGTSSYRPERPRCSILSTQLCTFAPAAGYRQARRGEIHAGLCRGL